MEWLRRVEDAIWAFIFPPKGVCAECKRPVGPYDDECGECWAKRYP